MIPTKKVPDSWIAKRPKKICIKTDFKTRSVEEGLNLMKKQLKIV